MLCSEACLWIQYLTLREFDVKIYWIRTALFSLVLKTLAFFFFPCYLKIVLAIWKSN